MQDPFLTRLDEQMDQMATFEAPKNIIMMGGSRWINQDTEEQIENVLAGLNPKTNEIYIGDCWGADYIIYMYARHFEIPVTVYGIQRKPRAFNVREPSLYIHYDATTYKDRDHHIIDVADQVMLWWNGKTPGTKNNADYARSQRKLVYLWDESCH